MEKIMQACCLFHVSPFRLARLIIGLFLLLAASGTEAGTLSIIGHSRWVEVGHVYDGDTFLTNKGEKVRLLGINTPEMPYNDRPGQIMAKKAKRRLAELISGKLVQLRMDKEKRGTYGRTLAQIYLHDGTWINALLVREGLAHVYIFAPNFRWAKALMQLESIARNNRQGIWKTERFHILSSQDVSNVQIGQFRLINGIVSAFQGWRFQLGGLMISVPRKARPWFKGGLRVQDGRKVTVRGTIRISGNGHLYLALHSPYDIE